MSFLVISLSIEYSLASRLSLDYAVQCGLALCGNRPGCVVVHDIPTELEMSHTLLRNRLSNYTHISIHLEL